MKLSIWVATVAATMLMTGPVSAGQDCADWFKERLNACGGFFAEAELLMLSWSDTDGDDGLKDLSAGSRYTVGYTTPGGRTFSARFFNFSAPDGTGGGGSGSLKINSADVEYAGNFSRGEIWDADLLVGVRWAAISNPTPRDWDNSVGPILGASFRSDLTQSLALYAAGRAAYLFGHEKVENHEHPISMVELMFGIEWTHRLDSGLLVIRSGVETQYYNSVRDDEEDIGLIGWTLGAGYRF